MPISPPSLAEAKARLRSASKAITPLALVGQLVRRHPAVSVGAAATIGALSVKALPRAYQTLAKHSGLAILLTRLLLRAR